MCHDVNRLIVHEVLLQFYDYFEIITKVVFLPFMFRCTKETNSISSVTGTRCELLTVPVILVFNTT